MLEISDISLGFPDFSMEGVSLDIRSGEYFILFGPTGSGKTLLLEVIAGLRTPSGGSVRIDGRDVTRADPARRGIGYVPQDLALIPFMNVRRNVEFGLHSKPFFPGGVNPRREIAARADEILEMLGIVHLAGRMPANLSGGEKQRAALGRALAVRPGVLLLDEPLSALDENTGDLLMREIKSLHQSLKITTVHVCHRLEEVFFMGDRMAVMREGEVAQSGAPEDVYETPADEGVARLIGAKNIVAGEVKAVNGGKAFFLSGKPLVRAGGEEGFSRAVINPSRVSLYPDGPPAALNGFLAEFRVAGLPGRNPRGELVLEGEFRLFMPGAAAPPGLKHGERVFAEIPAGAVSVLRPS